MKRSLTITELVFQHWDIPRVYELPCLSFSITKLAEEVLRFRFPEITEVPPIFFGKMKKVAFCQLKPGAKPLIVINSILNHGSTPVEILDGILTHEFLHIVVPSREVDGKMRDHPPEFWEQERRISPNVKLTSDWLHFSFYKDLVCDREKETTTIKNLRKHYKRGNFLSIEHFNELLGPFEPKEDAGCF